MKRVLGFIVVSIPFVGIFIGMVKTIGFHGALFVAGCTAVIGFCAVGGSWLIVDGERG